MTRRAVSALVAALLCLAMSAAPSGGASTPASRCSQGGSGGAWPTFGGDPANSRHQPAEDTIDAATAARLRPAWVFSSKRAGGAGDFTGTPVIAGGCVYAGSNRGWISALDVHDGTVVWQREVPAGGVVNNTLAVAGRRLLAYISREGAPYVAAFDRHSGTLLWSRRVDRQDGSDAFASPVVHRGVVIVGVSGDAAQHAESEQRAGFQGSVVLLDVTNGRILRKVWTIPRRDRRAGFDGATVSTPAAVDPATGTAYVGTSSPYQPQREHARTNALLRLDVDRRSPTFGRIVGVYKGDTFDAVVPGYSTLPCQPLPLPPPPPIVPTGRGVGACGDVDVDFAAAPNLIRAADGRLVVAASQKSGTFHAVDAATMASVWQAPFGPAQPFGGVSAAFDGSRLLGAGGPGGYAYALDATTGAHEWVAPIADGAHYGQPMAAANGVAYTVDAKGALTAFEADSGTVLATYPLSPVTASAGQAAVSFGGVSIAQHTVFAPVGFQNTGLDAIGAADGFIVAFRPR